MDDVVGFGVYFVVGVVVVVVCGLEFVVDFYVFDCLDVYDGGG